MKLAEALQERADLNVKIAQLNSRLADNAVYQEGEKPAEDPQELLKELDETIAALQKLMSRINLSNAVILCGGKTLTECIAERDALKLKIGAYRELIRQASNIARRASRTEIVIRSAVDVPKLQKEADRLAKEMRELDNRIQQTNWNSELI